MVWGRWVENSLWRFSLFTFHFFWFISTLWLAFYLSFACCSLLISRSFQCMVWGRGAENSICHFSLFAFRFFLFVSTLWCAFYSIFHLHAVFCSSADHSSAWFEVDEQRTASATFRFSVFGFRFSLFLVCFYTLVCILSFTCMLFFAHQPIIPVHGLR